MSSNLKLFFSMIIFKSLYVCISLHYFSILVRSITSHRSKNSKAHFWDNSIFVTVYCLISWYFCGNTIIEPISVNNYLIKIRNYPIFQKVGNFFVNQDLYFIKTRNFGTFIGLQEKLRIWRYPRCFSNVSQNRNYNLGFDFRVTVHLFRDGSI